MSEYEQDLAVRRLINKINSARDFGYDDEQVELNERLARKGLKWRWTRGAVEQVEVYNPLDEIELHGETLRYWHSRLTTTDGEPTGHLRTPASRYGSDADECAWWSLACEMVYVSASGENSEDDPMDALDYYMSMVVNDHSDVAGLVFTYWHEIPEALRDQLGTIEDVKAKTEFEG